MKSLKKMIKEKEQNRSIKPRAILLVVKKFIKMVKMGLA